MRLSSIAFLFFTIFTTTAHTQELKKEVRFTAHKFMPFYNLKKVKNTAIFQGNKQKKNYFEGWYFKFVAADGESIISIIPGLSLSENGEQQHAFIQLINGVTAETDYFTFDIDDFYFSKKELAIRIGKNYFSTKGVVLDIAQNGKSVKADLTISNTTDYSTGRLTKHSIMGWYRFVPFMECYHGVVSLTHQIGGQMQIGDIDHDFDGGKGYIEKDWGTSMPSAWIWLQTNHFTDTSSSLMLSVATVPFMNKEFDGFLGFFYHKGEVHRFATYKNSTLMLKVINDNTVKVTIKNRKYTFVIDAERRSTGMLQAPVAGNIGPQNTGKY